MLNYWRAVLLLIVFGDMARLARVVVLGLPHQITRRETVYRRPSSVTRFTSTCIDPKSEPRGLKVPGHSGAMVASQTGPFGIVGWYRQETAAIFDGGPQKARRRRARLDVKSAISRAEFRLYYVLITATGGFRQICKDRDNGGYG